MKLKVFCEGCNKEREIICELVPRGSNLWFQGCCSVCGTWWYKQAKKAEDVDPITGKHPPMKWFTDYLKQENDFHWRGYYKDRGVEWKGLIGEKKIKREDE